jgi:prepilin-type N-terminal cleavage/methylation domain-containing protein
VKSQIASKSCRHSAAFTLIEMAIVLSIVSLIFVSGFQLLRNTGVYARKTSTDLLESLVERGRSSAASSRSVALLAILEPGELPEIDEASMGIFRVIEWETGQMAVTVEMLQRWQPVEPGIVFARGDEQSIRNAMDEPAITLKYLRGEDEIQIEVHALAFTPRGRLHWPVGSDPVLIRLAEGSYRGKRKNPVLHFQGDEPSVAETRIRIGRTLARSYRLN